MKDDTFIVNLIKPILDETNKLLDNYYHKNYYTLKNNMINQLYNQVNKINNQEVNNLKYIIFTLLRTQIIRHEYKYRIYIYDDYFYGKRGIETGEIDVCDLFEFYIKLDQNIKNEFKRHVFIYNESLQANLTMSCLYLFNQYVVELLRKSFREVRGQFIEIAKDNELEVQCGELLEPCDTIYKYKVTDINYALNIFNKNIIRDLEFENFTGLDLSNKINSANMNFNYSDFSESLLRESVFNESSFIGVNFIKADMKKCKFSGCKFNEADFSQSDLSGSSFYNISAIVGRASRIVGYQPLKFENTNLENANFENSTLLGVDFTNSNLKGVNFRDSKLNGSKFTEHQIEYLKLEQEQKETIVTIQK